MTILYKGQAIHKICFIHGLKLGVVPDPTPKPTFEPGSCTICEIDGPSNVQQLVADPADWGGLRTINSGVATGVTKQKKAS